MSDYYCPHCGADLGDQPGFDPDAGYWTCTECGQFLTDPGDESDEPERFEGVGWFCDGCGAFLNKQSGFSDWYSTWTCTECGHVNNLSEDEIYESEEAYQASRSESDSDDSDDDDDGYGYGEEWQYDNPRRCECCNRLLNKQDGYEDWLGYFTCEKCGYYNEWSTDDDDDEEEDDDSSDSYSGGGGLYSSYDTDEEEDDEEPGSYFDSEEYKRHVQAEARRKERLAQEQEELRRAKEEERRRKQEQKKEQRKRLWRTITGKKQAIGLSSEQCRHMRYEDVVSALKNLEFYNISVSGSEDLPLENMSLEGTVAQILINGVDSFDEAAQFPFNAKISIVYHMLKTVSPPLTSKNAKRMDIEDVVWEFSNAGFRNIHKEALPDLTKGWLVKEDSVEKVTIDGRTDYKKSDRFRLDAQIVISYHIFKKDR